MRSTPTKARGILIHATGVYSLRGRIERPGFAVRIVNDLAIALGFKPVKSVSHVFPRDVDPPGITAAVILAESLISLHTYPETGISMLTISICRQAQPATVEASLGKNGLEVLESHWS